MFTSLHSWAHILALLLLRAQSSIGWMMIVKSILHPINIHQKRFKKQTCNQLVERKKNALTPKSTKVFSGIGNLRKTIRKSYLEEYLRSDIKRKVVDFEL